MRYVRPFSLDDLKSGPSPDWLLGPDEGMGLTIRLTRGGLKPRDIEATKTERFALVLTGSPRLEIDGKERTVAKGDLAFIPANAKGRLVGAADDVWVDIEADVLEASAVALAQDQSTRVIAVDPTRFEGGGFAYQSMIERKLGSQTMRINVLQVQPGSGSPNYHIHAFAQIYVIQDGEMTIEVGRKRLLAKQNSLVVLPAGVVHRNFNASAALEKHISLLVPEPKEGDIFDYAITIHDREAEMMTELPAGEAR